jgi:hypothetical protein
VAAPFATPADLAVFVAGCDLIIAHRMHACIAAHSFAVPTIGLTWDEKLTSFFALAGRALRRGWASPGAADHGGTGTGRAGRRGRPPRSSALIARTRADVAALGARIAGASACGGHRQPGPRCQNRGQNCGQPTCRAIPAPAEVATPVPAI